MIQCKTCAGFVPQSSSHCPNCSTEYTKGKACRQIKTAATIVGAGMISMTLMACYGAPPDYPHQLPDNPSGTSAEKEPKDADKEKDSKEKIDK